MLQQKNLNIITRNVRPPIFYVSKTELPREGLRPLFQGALAVRYFYKNQEAFSEKFNVLNFNQLCVSKTASEKAIKMKVCPLFTYFARTE